MNVLRGWLLDNLGIKLVALLLALLVYLNVYTDRPATLIVSFPLQIAINKFLVDKGKIVLFMNRRGFSTMTMTLEPHTRRAAGTRPS